MTTARPPSLHAIRLIPDLIELDETTRPPRARLLAVGAAKGDGGPVRCGDAKG